MSALEVEKIEPAKTEAACITEKRKGIKMCAEKRYQRLLDIQKKPKVATAWRHKMTYGFERKIRHHRIQEPGTVQKLIDDALTMDRDCVSDAFYECNSRLMQEFVVYLSVVAYPDEASERAAHSAAKRKADECHAKLATMEASIDDMGRWVVKWPHCESDCGKSEYARSGYQNMMNDDFDGILRPKLHDDYHYRHDDNIVSVADGYLGGYQPLISGESLGSVASSVAIIGASSVVMLFCVFCVCLAFGMVTYIAYSQKSALHRKRAKEEMHWIDDQNRNET